MNNLFIFLLSLFLAGIDPFLPAGSILVAYGAIQGADKKGGWVLLSLVISGLMRDVLLVERLGTSSLTLGFCWLISALGMTKFEKPLLVSLISAAAGAVFISLIEQKNIWASVLATLAFTLVLLFVHQIISAGSQSKIKLRGS